LAHKSSTESEESAIQFIIRNPVENLELKRPNPKEPATPCQTH